MRGAGAYKPLHEDLPPNGAEGEAIAFVSPGEEDDLHGIEKALGKAIPQVTLPGFDYRAPPPLKHRGHEDGRRLREFRGGGGRPRWRRGPPHR